MKNVLSKELSLPNVISESHTTKSTIVSMTDIPKYNFYSYLNLIKNHDAIVQEQIHAFLKICESENETSRIGMACNALCEEVENKISKEIVPSTKKVRNGKSTDQMNRHKIGTAVKAEITKAKTAAAKTLGHSVSQKKEQNNNESYINDCLDRILNVCNVSEAICTIISNQKKLNNRFDFNKFVQENSYDVKDSIFTLCQFIDTYNIPYGSKYKVALENIQYTLYKNAIPCDKNTILETVTDYFMISPSKLTQDHIKDLKLVLSKVNGYEENEINNLYIMKEESNSGINYMKELSSYEFTDLNDSFINAAINEGISGQDVKNSVDKLIDDFKQLPQKTPAAVKSLIMKIYTKDEKDIIDGTPNLLGLLRGLVIVGAFHAGLIAGCIALCADYTLKLTLERKQLKSLIAKYNKEIENVEKKIDRLKDEKSIERAEEYKRSLEDAVYKFEDYNDSINLIKDDEDEDLDESLIENLKSILCIQESISRMIDFDDKFIDITLSNQASKISSGFGNNVAETLTTIAINKPNIINPNNLAKVFKDRIKDLNSTDSSNFYSKSVLNTCIWDLEHKKCKKEDNKDCECNIESAIADLDLRYNVIDNITRTTYVNELGLTNSLKLASENLKRGIQSLADKDKVLSRQVDASVNTVISSAERAMQKGNREAVIKGQLIPSASKVIHWGIATGVTWLVNPVIAVIGVIGAIACAKTSQAKERQLILDEIEVELNLCEKQIKIAEDKDDMKALKNLYMTQRALQRQHQRIRYKMKVEWGQGKMTKTSDLGKQTTTMKGR
jgi:hypothetical protein